MTAKSLSIISSFKEERERKRHQETHVSNTFDDILFKILKFLKNFKC